MLNVFSFSPLCVCCELGCVDFGVEALCVCCLSCPLNTEYLGKVSTSDN